jgi:hypothetical protein
MCRDLDGEFSQERHCAMAVQQQRGEISRRQFLRKVGIVSVAAASGMGTAGLAWAAKTSLNRTKPLELDVMPDFRSSGGVLLDTPLAAYLIFKSLWVKKPADVAEAGTAVIELKGCLATRFRYPGGEPEAEDACLADSLECCRAYEVENSSWLQRVVRTLPRSHRQTKGGLGSTRHFVIAFFPNSFECLARDLGVEVRTEPFSVIAASLFAPL